MSYDESRSNEAAWQLGERQCEVECITGIHDNSQHLGMQMICEMAWHAPRTTHSDWWWDIDAEENLIVFLCKPSPPPPTHTPHTGTPIINHRSTSLAVRPAF